MKSSLLLLPLFFGLPFLASGKSVKVEAKAIAAAVAVATAITLNLSVEETAQLANAASECILVADRTDRFVLRLDDMIDRIGEIAWSLQVSKR